MNSNDIIKFSIGIPAFKGQFIKECVESVLNQTYKHFELVIINDCSPDNLKSIIDEYKDSRVHYYENETNTGAENVVDNWNKCLAKARGEYFILMGDDDTMAPNYLDEFNNLITKYPGLNVYHCRSLIINKNSEVVDITPINPEYEDLYDYILACLTENNRIQYISDFVYRTEPLKNKNGYFKLPLAWASDYLSAFIATKDFGIAHTNKTLLNYRISDINITSTGSLVLKRKAIIQFANWISEYLQEIPADPLDKIRHQLVYDKLEEFIKDSKIAFIRQYLGQNKKLSQLINCIKYKKELEYSNADIYQTIRYYILGFSLFNRINISVNRK